MPHPYVVFSPRFASWFPWQQVPDPVFPKSVHLFLAIPSLQLILYQATALINADSSRQVASISLPEQRLWPQCGYQLVVSMTTARSDGRFIETRPENVSTWTMKRCSCELFSNFDGRSLRFRGRSSNAACRMEEFPLRRERWSVSSCCNA